MLETGGKVPADCLLLEGTDLTVDESYYHEQNENIKPVKKQTITQHNFRGNPVPDPFLLSQTVVIQGTGKALVCCVGVNSRRGIVDEKLDTTSKTPLQIKLDNLAARFTKWGIFAAFAILVASIVRLVLLSLTKDLTSSSIAHFVCTDISIAVTIIVVAVPEGLPLTITISLAYSVMRMRSDGILVKNLNSPEVMGNVEEILTGKTATLTKNEMKVTDFYVEGRIIKNSRTNTLFNCDVSQNSLELIKESILFNCDSRIEMDDTGHYVAVGNGTECSLIRFIQDAEVPVHDIINRKLGKIQAEIPFSTIKKKSVVAMQHPNAEEIIRVYVKGAPEQIVNKCTKTLGADGRPVILNEQE